MIRRQCGMLAAYQSGNLSESDRLAFEDHVKHCRRCAKSIAITRSTEVFLTKAMQMHVAPETLWKRIETQIVNNPPGAAEAKLAGVSSGRQLPQSARRYRRITAAALSTCAATAALIVTVHRYRHPVYAGPFWQITRVSGAPRVESERIGASGKLEPGQWLETDSHSQAQITVANIGQIDVSPNTLIGLTATGKSQNRLSLRRGQMSARVVAPPRLFIVDTPSATAVDLGCSYTLCVLPNGDALLHVTSGHVALTRSTSGKPDFMELSVPALASCRTRQGIGAGTPVYDEASPVFKAALEQYDTGRNPDAAFNTIITKSQLIDTLSLWPMLWDRHATNARRVRLIDRIIRLVPLEKGVTRSGLINGNSKMLETWHEALQAYW